MIETYNFRNFHEIFTTHVFIGDIMETLRKVAGLVPAFFMFLLLIGLYVVTSVGLKSCGTASDMADKTVFNAQQHVVSYEQFRDDYQAYMRYVNSYCDYKKRINKNNTLSMEEKATMDGYYKMAMDVAQRYNANAMKFYKKVWKGDLPERLPLEVNCDQR